ncbi:uncharacterized protein LOC105793725 [Gossypium raimondii]|uniref:Prolamin-like domain-containing protein n=1 Tax=Gossypium raimondii TaxID=29730 RepID=A0A0D2PI85_GOSRA|nr:uncharacterized protein LOC105793725 [Gossypium raimondii]KJB26663.1 hypothetical protein B456_004G253800 [Gossypium raimondii]
MKSSFSAFLFVLLAILITLGEQGVAAGRWWYPSSPPPPPQNGWVWTWPWPVYSYPPPPTAVKPPSHHGQKSPPLPPPPPQPPMVNGKCLGTTLASKLTCLQDVISSILMFRPYVSPECCAAVQATHEDCLNTIFDEFNNPFLAPLVQQQCFQTPNPNPNPNPKPKPHHGGHHRHGGHHHHGGHP